VSRLTQLIHREMRARSELLVGTVVGELRPVRFDDDQVGAGVMWVVDVEIGSNRPLFSVPVKAGSDGGRFFANLGQTVLLRRNLLGRWQVVGPGDRRHGVRTTTEYDLTTGAAMGSAQDGSTIVIDPFEYYQGDQAMLGNPVVTFSREVGNDLIVRATGDFTAEGFAVSDSIVIGGTQVNDGTQTIAAVSALQIEIAGDVLFDEGPVDGVTIIVAGTSRWNNGLDGFPSKRIVDGDGNTIRPT